MAFAGVYIAAHYPQDVLAGLALGAAIALLIHWAIRPVLIRLLEAASTPRLQPLITARPVTPQLVVGDNAVTEST
jgi:undecaprenyl-diphosphatase